MAQQMEQNEDRFLATPVGRRAVLALGVRGAARFYAALVACSTIGLLSSLAGCYRAPGTARDQLIFFSEEKELEFGLSAYREVLRQARLSENAEINELVQRVGQRIAKAANKPEYQWEFAVIDDDNFVRHFFAQELSVERAKRRRQRRFLVASGHDNRKQGGRSLRVGHRWVKEERTDRATRGGRRRERRFRREWCRRA